MVVAMCQEIEPCSRFQFFWRGWMTELGVPRGDSCRSQAGEVE